MYNWSTDKNLFVHKGKKDIWHLEQLVNFGLNGEKIDKAALRLHWNQLTLDPNRRKFLELLLNV